CQKLGLRGILVWQTPHPSLPFSSNHYDPLWTAAEELAMPVSFHILTGFNYSRDLLIDYESKSSLDLLRGSVAGTLSAVMDSLIDFIGSGVFDRFPRLKLVVVENEIGWLPFFVDQIDWYYKKFADRERPLPIQHSPSKYVENNVRATFFRDPLVGQILP